MASIRFQHTEDILMKTQYISLLSIKINDLLFSKDLFGWIIGWISTGESKEQLAAICCRVRTRHGYRHLQHHTLFNVVTLQRNMAEHAADKWESTLYDTM